MQTPRGRTRVGVTPVACDFCRRQKTKCDGARPICGRCRRRGCQLPCQYDKVQSVRILQEEVSKLQAELDRAKDFPELTMAPPRSTQMTEQRSGKASMWSQDPHQIHLQDGAPQDCHPDQSGKHGQQQDTPTSPMQVHHETSPTATHRIRDSVNGSESRRQTLELNVTSPSIANVFGDHSMRSAITCNHYPDTYQGKQLSNIALPEHLSSTLWLEPDKVPGVHISWVNKAFWEMRSRGRWLAKNGLDTAAIMGETCPNLSPFSPSPNRDDTTSFWTVSRWASRFVDQFSHLSHADRLACWIVMFVTFQWQICPNADTFRTIPDWYRPLPIQNFVPHMPCLDILIWPSARSYLTEHPLDFVQAVMSSISVSWPHGDSQLYSTDLLTGKRTIDPNFVSWCLDISHWSVSESSMHFMPQLKGKVKTR